VKSYRLGDFVRFHSIESLEFPKESIANEYFTKSCFPKNKKRRRPVRVDFKTLAEIVDSKNFPTIDELAIHLRLGDQYGKRIKIEDYINIIVNNIDIIKTKKCKVYCKNHRPIPRSVAETDNYLYKLISEIKNLGFSVASPTSFNDKKIGNPWELVDQDFIELANSKYLIAGRRGFGWLSACMNKNQVFWDAYKMQNNIPDLIWDPANLKKPNDRNSAYHITHLEGFIFQKKHQFEWKQY